MNRPAVRVVSALLALAAAGFVLVITAAGFIGLAVSLVATHSISHRQVVAVAITAAGFALLFLAHGLDPQAVHSAVIRARAVSFDLATILASRGAAATNTTTGPVRVCDLLPGTLAEMARRAGRTLPESMAAYPPAVPETAVVPVSRPAQTDAA